MKKKLGAIAVLTVAMGLAWPGVALADHEDDCSTALANPAGFNVINGAGFISGTDGNDLIIGSTGNDFISARGGDDLVCGIGGSDTVNGGDGNNRLLGDVGISNPSPPAAGTPGNDTLSGGSGDDSTLFGGEGTDDINGGQASTTCEVNAVWATGATVVRALTPPTHQRPASPSPASPEHSSPKVAPQLREAPPGATSNSPLRAADATRLVQPVRATR